MAFNESHAVPPSRALRNWPCTLTDKPERCLGDAQVCSRPLRCLAGEVEPHQDLATTCRHRGENPGGMLWFLRRATALVGFCRCVARFSMAARR
jgi:hypothetical protein